MTFLNPGYCWKWGNNLTEAHVNDTEGFIALLWYQKGLDDKLKTMHVIIFSSHYYKENLLKGLQFVISKQPQCFQWAAWSMFRPTGGKKILILLQTITWASRLLWLSQKNALERREWSNVMEVKWSKVMACKGFCYCVNTALCSSTSCHSLEGDTIQSLRPHGFGIAATLQGRRRLTWVANWIRAKCN